MSLNLPRTMDGNECAMTCTKQREKQYALSQPCLHQLVKGLLLPQDGIGIIQSATPATQNDVPFKRESTACKRECATMHAKSSWGYIGVWCPFQDASMAEHTVANTSTVKKNFLRVFYLPYILTFCLAAGMCLCPSMAHCIRSPLPELAIWSSGPHVAHCIRSSRYSVRAQVWPTASGAGRGGS